jgi:hypothetical protein
MRTAWSSISGAFDRGSNCGSFNSMSRQTAAAACRPARHRLDASSTLSSPIAPSNAAA